MYNRAFELINNRTNKQKMIYLNFVPLKSELIK